MPKFIIVHVAEAEDAEQADTIGNKLALPFTPKDRQPELAMVAQVDDPDDDIACAMVFLPEAEIREGDDGTVVISTGVPR